ncbi:DUF5134 domain-containing protein [Streptomyces sp. NPDC101237]|uniref:DUF5134 domain-containing protein n=1 Tax=Streptomyces sp. NPDC101237 TaxID=3366139 RepID=UPI0038274020
MIAASGLRWILTLVFALTAAHGILRGARPGLGLPERVDHALHAVMGLFMIAMVWPWGMDVPALPQVVVFTAGAVWFVSSAPFRAEGGFPPRKLPDTLFHAVMMVAMAWMVAVMDPSGMTAGQGGGGAGHSSMAGMDMSGGSGLSTMSLAGAGRKLAAGLLALVLLAFALRWLARAFDAARAMPAGGPEPVVGVRADAVSPACHGAMALGMAVMFALLL